MKYIDNNTQINIQMKICVVLGLNLVRTTLLQICSSMSSMTAEIFVLVIAFSLVSGTMPAALCGSQIFA